MLSIEEGIKLIAIPFISAIIGSISTYYFFKIKSKWELNYKAFNNALIKLENLKYIAFQQSLQDDLTGIVISPEKRTREYLSNCIFETIEALIPIKVQFEKNLRNLIEAYEKKITRHYNQKFRDYDNIVPTGDQNIDYLDDLYIYLNHCSRIYRSTSALIKVLQKKRVELKI